MFDNVNFHAIVSAKYAADVTSSLLKSHVGESDVIAQYKQFCLQHKESYGIDAEVTFHFFSDAPTSYYLEYYTDIDAICVYRFVNFTTDGQLRSIRKYLGMVTIESVTQLDCVTSYDEFIFSELKSLQGTVLVKLDESEF